MDTNFRMEPDLVERRRLQNRLAQRRFRERKKCRASDDNNNNNNDAIIDTLWGSPSSYGPADDLLLSLTNHNNEIPTTINQELEDASATFDIDLIHQLPYPSPDTPPFTPTQRAPAAPFQLPCRMSETDNPTATELTPCEPQRSSRRDNSVLQSTTSAGNDERWIGTLHIAAQRGHERIVRLLLLHSARKIDVNIKDSDGRTPLLHAVIQDHETVVRLLLAHGARIGVFDRDGRSALHWAVLCDRPGVLRLLLEHSIEYERGMGVNVYDNAGWTPLHIAVDRAFETGVQLLLQCGADIDVKAHTSPSTGKGMLLMD